MLVLSRRVGEEIVIDGKICLTVIEARGRRVTLGIVAPPSVSVHRQEVCERPDERNAVDISDRKQADYPSEGSMMSGLIRVAR